MLDDLGPQPGYTGGFTRSEAVGAVPNGGRIMKQKSEPGDAHPDGSLGTVLGSVDVVSIDPALARRYASRFFYFIEWDAAPRVAVGVAGFKVGVPS